MKAKLRSLITMVIVLAGLAASAQYTGGDGRSDHMDQSGTMLLSGFDAMFSGGSGRGDHMALGSGLQISPCTNPTSAGTIAGDQTICSGADPVAFTSSALPTGHVGTLEYQWQSSATGSSIGFIDITGATGEVYDSPALTQTTWYRRLARVDCETDWSGAAESNVLEVTVKNTYSTDHFRTKATGNWADVATWESSPDEVNWCAATLAPTSNAASVGINHQVSLAENATVGDITITEGSTLDLQNHQLLVTGNWINNGTLSAGTSTVTFSGSGANTLGGTSINNFSSLFINKPNGSLTASGSLAVSGLLHLQAGTYNSASDYHDVLIESSGTLVLTGDITVSGNWTNNGMFTHNGNTVTFNGFEKTIGGTNATAFSTITLASDAKITGAIAPTASIFNIQSNATYVHAHDNSVVPGTTKNFSASSTYEWRGIGNFPSISGITFGNLIINTLNGNNNASGRLNTVLGNLTILNTGTGSYRLAGSTNPEVTISGNLVVEDGEFNFSSTTGEPVVTVHGDVILNGGILKPQLSTGVPLLNIHGNWVKNDGEFVPGSCTVTFNGTAQQTLAGSSETDFYGLTINNTSGIQLHNNQSVSKQLTLTDGIITTNTSVLTVLETGNITGGSATSHVSGKLARVYNVTGSKDFPFGKAGNYYPMSLNFTSLTGTSTVTAETYSSGFPGTAPTGTTQVGMRYWNVTQAGTSSFNYNITLDGLGLTFTNDPVVYKYDAPNTLVYFASADENNYTATGLTSFSDFALGECQPPSISIQPSGDAQFLCKNAVAEELSVSASGYELSYQWYKNTNNVNSGGDVVGTDTNTYTIMTNEAGTLYYYVVITGGCGTATSTVSGEVTVYPEFTAGAIKTDGETICYGGTPTIIGSETDASGGDGSITYSWRSSADDFTAAIDEATAATYTPPALTATNVYRRYAKDGKCNTEPEESVGTWTVTVRVPLSVSDPNGKTVNTCNFNNEAAMQNDFDAWVIAATVSVTNSITGASSPTVTDNRTDFDVNDIFCKGGVFTLTWEVNDVCGTVTTSAEYNVNVPSAVVVSPVANETTFSCIYADQEAANAAFVAWMNDFEVSSGCTPTFSKTPEKPVAPDYCGGSAEVVWTITDHCYNTSTHTATFTITAPNTLTYNNPSNSGTQACNLENQAALNAVLDQWLDAQTLYIENSFSGGCNPVAEHDFADNYPDFFSEIPVIITVTWTIQDHCLEPKQVSASFTFNPGNVLAVSNIGTGTEEIKYYCTIQDAIDNASVNDVILISAGTYPETATTKAAYNLTLRLVTEIEKPEAGSKSTETIDYILDGLNLHPGDVLDMKIISQSVFDKLIVLELLDLNDATLQVTSYQPEPGNTFEIITYGSLLDKFANKYFVSTQDDKSFIIDYNGNVSKNGGLVVLTNVRRLFRLEINGVD